MTIKLPQKPDFAHEFLPRWPVDPGGFNESQMDAYGKACALAVLEEAAKLLEYEWNGDSDTFIEAETSNQCAKAIRALRTELENTK